MARHADISDAACHRSTGNILTSNVHPASLSTPVPRHRQRAPRRDLCAGLGRGIPARRRRRCAARRSGRRGAGARGALWRVVRRHPHQPLSPRIDRDARAAGAERVALDQLRLRPARAGQRRVGLCRDQPRRPGRGARRGRAGGRHRARRTRVLATRKVVLANADKVVDHLDQRLQARSVRRAARDQDRVPDEAERNGAGGRRRHLRQLADAVRGRAEVLRLERRLADHAAAGAHLSAVHDHRRRPRHAATSRRAPSSIAPSWSATSTSRTIPGCRTPRRPATRWSRS